MFYNVSNLPYSLHSVIQDNYVVVTEEFSFRPDKLFSSVIEECFCNEIGNFSPLSFIKGAVYPSPSRKYRQFFLKAGL